MNSDLDAIALASQKCNQYGLDTISTGNTIAYAMEASEKGYMEDDLNWGDPETIVELVEKIAKRDGWGMSWQKVSISWRRNGEPISLSR